MDGNQQNLKEQFEKLPNSLRSFISKGEWSVAVSNIAKQFNLAENKYASFENEVLFVLIGLQHKENFAENIRVELEIDTNMAGWITEDVNKNIFSKVAREIDEMWKDTEQETGEKQNSVGQSFEQIILNQAKAMKPAVPENLPTENKPDNKPHTEVPNYSGGDPYREPLG